jgi:hypothetical protein
VVHLDIRPETLRISRHCTLKLTLGMGLGGICADARNVRRSLRLERMPDSLELSDEMFGSRARWPPEIILHGASSVARPEAVDTWHAGLVLAAMLWTCSSTATTDSATAGMPLAARTGWGLPLLRSLATVLVGDGMGSTIAQAGRRWLQEQWGLNGVCTRETGPMLSAPRLLEAVFGEASDGARSLLEQLTNFDPGQRTSAVRPAASTAFPTRYHPAARRVVPAPPPRRPLSTILTPGLTQALSLSLSLTHTQCTRVGSSIPD